LGKLKSRCGRCFQLQAGSEAEGVPKGDLNSFGTFELGPIKFTKFGLDSV